MTKEKSTDAPHLSEHFHKVRLTSLTLSIGLFLTSVLKGAPAIIATVFGNLGPEDRNFVVIALAIAATVSMIHVWTLWWGEFLNAKASLRASLAVEEDLLRIRSQCAVVIPKLGDEAALATAGAQRLQSLNISLLDPESLERAIASAPSEQAREDLRRNLIMHFQLAPKKDHDAGTMVAATMQIRAGAEAVFASRNVVASPEELGKIAEPIAELARKYYEELDALYTRMNNTAGEGVSKFTGEYLAAIDLWKTATLNRRSGEEATMREKIAELSHEVQIYRRNTADQLTDLTTGLEKVLRPLESARRSTKMQVYVLDLLVPAAMFLLAIAHAIGRLFGGVGSAIEWSNGILQAVATSGWWAEVLIVTMYFGSIAIAIWWTVASERKLAPASGDDEAASER